MRGGGGGEVGPRIQATLGFAGKKKFLKKKPKTKKKTPKERVSSKNRTDNETLVAKIEEKQQRRGKKKTAITIKQETQTTEHVKYQRNAAN